MATIEDIMEVIQVVKKGQFMNLLEKFHIYKETCMNNQLNEQSTLEPPQHICQM
jgi:hypothetical protein